MQFFNLVLSLLIVFDAGSVCLFEMWMEEIKYVIGTGGCLKVVNTNVYNIYEPNMCM